MTVPSPVAQGAMIADCLKKTGVDPETIRYIEAHGTGTSLGDPIEIQGLNRAIREFTDKKQFCALGSIKSNLGHAESAAGVCGLTKTILQLHHKTLVKSLHSETINPYLDFESSPFYVQRSTEEWRLDDSSKTKLRRAGVSSFGATGSNAHVILEESPLIETDAIQNSVSEGVLLPLSAKNQERLQVYVNKLVTFLETNNSVDLPSLAFTLQTGRVALDERLIVLVTSIEQARNQFKRFLQGSGSLVNVWQGSVKSNALTTKLFDGDEDLQEAIGQWIAKGKWKKIAELWVQGYTMNWYALYDEVPRRIHLPTYPFSRERYWIPGPARKKLNHKTKLINQKSSRLHPLVHQNTSNYSENVEKPRTISLQSLSQEQLFSKKPSSPSTASITLTSTSTIPPPAVVHNKSEAKAYGQAFISAEKLQEELSTSFAKALYMKRTDVDADKPFVDMGLDSIVGVEWIGTINKKYGTSIQATKIYDYPTVRELAGFLEKELEEHGGRFNQAPVKSPTSSPRFSNPGNFQTQEIGSIKENDRFNSSVHTVGQPFFPLNRDHIGPREKTFFDSSDEGAHKVGSKSTNLFQEESGPRDVGYFRSSFIRDHSESIAIVGMSGMYAGASNLDRYWENLVQAKNSIQEIPRSRWDVNTYYDPRPSQPGKVYCKSLGLLDAIDCFNPLFFNISPSEAELMDPQHRLFLQEGYRAFEDAGYGRQSLNNSRCGVYLGIMSNEYQTLILQYQIGSTTGNSFAIAAARIAYYLNLKGPAISIDTACSSSLVATHLACQALSNQEIDMALVGGVTLFLTPDSYINMCAAGMLSPDGQCKTFDNDADGFVPGEGVGCLVLKRLRDAEADHDVIHGVIIGSGINQDGKTNGMTAPSVTSQIDLEREIYQNYKIDPASISYVEMHGTGTKLGDPIELEALSTVFKEQTKKSNYCAIGSVKSNIGHTSAAAGVASIQKVLLLLMHKKLVPTLNFNKPNEHFDFENSPFYVNTQLKPWDIKDGDVRRAAISSFGFSGTNAHLIIEEYLDDKLEIRNPKSEDLKSHIIVLSAKNEDRLKEVAKDLHVYLTVNREPGTLNLHDVAYTLQVGREPLEERLGFVVESLEELQEKLKGFVQGQNSVEKMYLGQVKPTKETLAVFTVDEELQEAIDKWIQRRKYGKLLDLWVKGMSVDWTKLYRKAKLRRLSLPTYPFAKERYWIPETGFRGFHRSGPKEQQLTNGTQEDKIQKLDSDLGDNQGNDSAQMKSQEIGEAGRDLEIRHQNCETFTGYSADAVVGEISLIPVWDSISVPKNKSIFPGPMAEVIIAGGKKEQSNGIREIYSKAKTLELNSLDAIESITAKLKARGTVDHIVWIAPDVPLKSLADEIIIQEQSEGVLSLFRLVKALLFLGYDGKKLGWTLITFQAQAVRKVDSVNPTHAGIHGFVGSMAKEYPNWQIRIFDLENESDCQMNTLWTIPPDAGGEVLAYRDKQWFAQRLIPVHESPNGKSLYRQNGVYIVIGGAGGLGDVLSRELIEQYQVQMVWIGRRPKDAAIQARVDTLSRVGPAPHYIAADARDRGELQRAYEEVKERYSEVHGVFHSALSSYDQSLAEMDEDQFKNVLSVKVDVSVRIAQVFQEVSLDFVMFFSSMAALAKPRGMSSYAAGCTFKDAFVLALSKSWSCAGKVMNWGYWSIGGGERISRSLRNHFEQNAGIRAIEPRKGMNALHRLLNGSLNQLAFVTTQKPEKLEKVNLHEWITRYPNTIPSCIQGLQQHLRKLNAPARRSEEENLNEWMVKLLLVQLQELGILQKGSSDDVTILRKKAGVLDKYDLWWREALNILKNNRYVSLEAGEVKVAEDIQFAEKQEVWSAWESHMEGCLLDSETRIFAVIINDCFRQLPEILRGKTPVTDILFPNGSTEKMVGVYKNNLISDYFNEVVASIANTYVKQRLKVDPQARIRIIEIGAGTGGTTSAVLTYLGSYQTSIEEYCFTDVSKSFLIQAKDRYGSDFPYMAYKLWNIEEPLAEQKIQPGSYDIAIATNVLHATKTIRNTLRNTKGALAKNGILILNEISEKTVFTTLMFGLIDGWSLAEDEVIRIPGSPGLYAEAWRQVLNEEGFGNVQYPVEEDHRLGQQIVLAESDGVVRQKSKNPVIPFSQFDDIKITSQVFRPKMTVSSFDGTAEHQTENLEIASPQPEPVKMTSPSEERAEDLGEIVEDLILDSLSQSLRIDKSLIEKDVPFSDYGVDSILGVNFINQLNVGLGITLNTTIVFDYTTVDRLADHITNSYKNQIEVKKKSSDFVKEVASRELTSSQTVEPQPGQQKPEVFIPTPNSDTPSKPIGIAVIGYSGQFPGAKDVEGFWQNLIQGKDAVHELPPHYLDLQKYFSPDRQPGKTYCRWGGILDERDCFDPLFFKLSPRDAESMSPHQRLFLQESWKGLEDAGYNPKALAGSRTGIFVGSEPTGYFHNTFVGASEAIIASRLSYFLNLRGPAFVVNTGCSSSGVAIHLACENLRNRESDLALAGGVFSVLDEKHLISLSQAAMLSATGRCFTFDKSGDGMVLSEGVGIVVLKRLKEALKDGDSIHGVIAASGMNQDGASNGITAPSGLAQEELIAEVYRRYGINPQEISYIEAHGTGTKLGDPVEANALVRAFKKFTDKKHFCALGSAKSHIGHTAASAGVIGLIKVLLSLQHHKIPGLLHLKHLNPQIEFKDSPFYCPTEVEEWNSKDNKPLMAALNSFGHSGTNVHLVVREWIPLLQAQQDPKPLNAATPVIIPISAKTKEGLKAYAEKLRVFLEQQSSMEEKQNAISPIQKVHLVNLAYTLQTGREAMNERGVILAKSIPDLIEKLSLFVESEEPNGDCYIGNVELNKAKLQLLVLDEDTQELVTTWMTKRKLKNLAEIWCLGVSIDWNLLYKSKPHRISLPTYPFAKERYWIKEKSEARSSRSKSEISPTQRGWQLEAGKKLHPLVHENTSNFEVQEFSSTFTGEEFFLTDHMVNGQKFLPGVAYLEMARVAIDQALGTNAEKKLSGIQLKNIIWSQPFVVEAESAQVHISLFPETSGEIAFEIFRESETGEDEWIIHSQGRAVENSAIVGSRLDIQVLQRDCSQKALSSEECYEAFDTMGFSYGPSHQGIEEIYIGENQVLARLSLPSSVSSTLDQFILHPGVLDSALQASIGLGALEDRPHQLALPFALQSLEIFAACTSSMWALVGHSKGGSSGGKVQKVDVQLCDEKGNVCIIIWGLSFRVLDVVKQSCNETIMLRPHWQEQPIDKSTTVPEYAQHQLIFCGPNRFTSKLKEVQLPGVDFLTLESVPNLKDPLTFFKGFQSFVGQVFEVVQTILKAKPQNLTLVQIVIPFRGNGSFEHAQFLTGIFGLLKAAHLENPQFIGQLIEVDSEEIGPEIAINLQENGRCPQDQWIRCEAGKRWIRSWSGVKRNQEWNGIPWKEGGVYLITGGAGGLGLIFAQEIFRQVKGSKIILTGRSAEDKVNHVQIEALRKRGACLEYQRTDISDDSAVKRVVREIQRDFGTLHGIIHAAGVIQDNFIIKKSQVELESVLAPKVAGVINLDSATQHLDLDFFVLFSSLAGCLGNVGQADYACANSFLDVYASYRDSLVNRRQRRGQTLSINWPLWKEGGMHVDKALEKMINENTGMISMQTCTGIEAFYQASVSGCTQVMVMVGDRQRMYAALFREPSAPEVSNCSNHAENDEIIEPIPPETVSNNLDRSQKGDLKERMVSYLKQILASTLKLKPEKMNVNESLDNYGLDSIVVLEINNQLEQNFSNLSKTLFFEYSTISELAGYFTESHREEVLKLFRSTRVAPKTEESYHPELEQDEKGNSYRLPPSLPKRTHTPKELRFLHRKPAIENRLGMSARGKSSSDGISKKLVDAIEKGNLYLDDILTLTDLKVINHHNNEYAVENNRKNSTLEITEPILIHQDDLKKKPELFELIRTVDEQYPPIGYERLLYPYYFLPSAMNRYIRLILHEENRLIIPLMPLNETLYKELLLLSQHKQYQLLLVDGYCDWLDQDDVRIIPLGVWQNVDMNQFTLSGSKMRKLRYAVEKFKQSGEVKTEEYHSHSILPLHQLKHLMIKWGESKKNVIQHSFSCMTEILQRTLPISYRVFLTYHNNQPCSVIVIERGEDGSYIMDQEFYDPASSPYGHMEFAIAEIIRQLKKENAKTFSFGLTWHPFIFEDHPKKDPEGWTWLKEQNDKGTLLHRIFHQGKSNYQFKKKFGVDGDPVFAYLPRTVPFSILLNYWPVFYQNSITSAKLTNEINKIVLSDDSNVRKKDDSSQGVQPRLSKNERLQLLRKIEKIEELDYSDNPLDLQTDSWFSIQSHAVKERTAYLKTNPHLKSIEVLQSIFPFKHILLNPQGRVAEELFYKVYPKTQKKIVTAIPWGDNVGAPVEKWI